MRLVPIFQILVVSLGLYKVRTSSNPKTKNLRRFNSPKKLSQPWRSKSIGRPRKHARNRKSGVLPVKLICSSLARHASRVASRRTTMLLPFVDVVS